MVLERATERVFAVVARLRRARALHPRGVTLHGRGRVRVESGLADRPEVRVVVRLSRGAGLPHPLPDVHGVAVRFVDAHGAGRHQDLLLSGAGRAPVLRHVLRPALRFDRAGGTTVLPYRRPGGGRLLFGCDPVPVATLVDVPAALPLTISLHEATPLGRWRPVAELQVDEVDPDDLRTRFDPWHTTPVLEPAGLLNRLRRAAYSGSRAGTNAAPGKAPA
jgi:hypothetical protein